MNFLSALQLGIGAAQSIFELTRHVETPGNGAAKKEAVKTLAFLATKTAFEIAQKETLDGDSQQILAKTIDSTVDGVVQFYNAIGIFQKTPHTTISATPAVGP